MKFRNFVLPALMLSAASIANAQIVADGAGFFKDDATGYEWQTLNTFYNQDLSTQLSNLAPGFAEATLAQVVQLSNSMPITPDAAWVNDNAIVMGSTSRNLIWGNDNGATINTVNWFYAYEGDSAWSNYNPLSTVPFSDLGLWAVNVNASTSSTPEPGAIALIGGLGVSGLGFLRRRRAARKA